MRKLKSSNNYLRNQTWKNLSATILCIVGFVALVFLAAFEKLVGWSWPVDFFELAALLGSLVPLGGAFFFWGKYRVFKGGLEGEKRVAKTLSSALSNKFYLLSGVAFGRGDVDQIVVGPNGVFVLETKNWSGKIGCSGDDWQRNKGGKFKGSPSMQLKRNVSQVKTVIGNSEFKALNIPVVGILVFANRHADLHLNRPTVAVTKLDKLVRYILQFPERDDFSGNLPRQLGKELLKNARKSST
ncbi:MAG: nuclease-related domain-containing protein [Candidatus Bathyarchaeia archaeon]|jgi:hypothetical protein